MGGAVYQLAPVDYGGGFMTGGQDEAQQWIISTPPDSGAIRHRHPDDGSSDVVRELGPLGRFEAEMVELLEAECYQSAALLVRSIGSGRQPPPPSAVDIAAGRILYELAGHNPAAALSIIAELRQRRKSAGPFRGQPLAAWLRNQTANRLEDAFGVVWVFELLELPPAEVAAVKGIGKVQMAAIRGIAKRAAAESVSD
jgi:hypothetical protein